MQVYNNINDLALAREMALTPLGEGSHGDFFMGEGKADLKKQMASRFEELKAVFPDIEVAHAGKIGRNATCPCGSGLKFKKCCISKVRSP